MSEPVTARQDLRAALAHVETWVFDLDNTLYPPAARLFDQVNGKITGFVMRELALDEAAANALRARYYHEYGTTLAGLMAVDGVPPDAYLDEVHEIDLTALAPDLALRDAITALPGRKIVYTNGSRLHAERVTGALGLAACFEALYGVEDAGYRPKPRAEAFARVFEQDGLAPARAAMIEDDQRNLRAPAALGMATIWATDCDAAEAEPHVRHVTADLAAFLSRAC